MKPVDLNLVLHFDALMRRASVSRAAELIGISQPAMSGALQRLRQLFQDPLLIRSGQLMVPTERALELHRLLAPMLEQWQQAIEAREVFAPGQATRAYTLLATDYAQYLMLPGLAATMADESPGIRLAVQPINPIKTLQLLETNQIEFAIGQFENPPSSLRTRPLHEEDAVCLVCRDHPATRAPWDIAAFAAARHLRVTSSNLGNFATVLEQILHGLAIEARVQLTLSSYLAAPHVVARTELVATLPRSVAVGIGGALPVQMLALPFDVPPIRLALYWHERHHGDAAHRWLRERIVAAFAATSPGPRGPSSA